MNAQAKRALAGHRAYFPTRGDKTTNSISGVSAVEEVRQADMMSVHLRWDGQVTTLSPALAHSRCSVNVGGVSAGRRHPSLHGLPGRRVGYLAQSYPLAIGTFEPRLQSSHSWEILQNYGWLEYFFASQVNNLK